MAKTDEINEAAAPAVDQMEMVKDHMNYELVDKEVAQYANEVIVEIDDETDKRLKKLIDKRIPVKPVDRSVICPSFVG